VSEEGEGVEGDDSLEGTPNEYNNTQGTAEMLIVPTYDDTQLEDEEELQPTPEEYTIIRHLKFLTI